MNKSLITNLIAIVLVIAGFLSPVYADVLLSIGLFALSGAITNWLAIHMLFERVPLLYGSGVIPNQFEDFKSGIKNIIMLQFFTTDNIKRFIQSEEESAKKTLDLTPVLDAVDYDNIFQKLIDAINASSLGAMLKMVGGAEALEPLRQPVSEKMRAALQEIAQSERFQAAIHKSLSTEKLSADISVHIEKIVDARLNELTPDMVKNIIQHMIKKHLGWLVVWGGVFGGLIGLIASYI
ncbi:DUF445 family protein [Neptunomonas qingdaonensis]|uniref:DUF445 domain-containing protein n=1 Tax=Neptunomonas qingdaonensis TaxID=1045558 RepID=A0A1I2UQ10_9GAMM|nr:DUF445 family protein [Neptunomonas qingdaonensis]SFG77787.1 Protein of unknown function [Neptunomonas qingdaonensis]